MGVLLALLGLLAMISLAMYIATLVVFGLDFTHRRIRAWVRQSIWHVTSAPFSAGHWIIKKTVPNSFPLERLAKRLSTVELQLQEMQLHYQGKISAMWPRVKDFEADWESSTDDPSEYRLSNRYTRTLLERLRYGLKPILMSLQEGAGTKEQRQQFTAALGDLETLLSFTPVGAAKEYRGMPGDTKKQLLWDRSIEANFTDEALTVFMERASEVEEALSSLNREINAAKNTHREMSSSKVISALKDVRLSSTSNQHRGVPVLSMREIPQEQRSIFEQAKEKMNSLPVIEGERVKRILADSAEAQNLAKEAREHGELSFDGRSPEEMVSAILAGNAEMLNRTMEDAVHSERAADQLWALERFTEEKIARG